MSIWRYYQIWFQLYCQSRRSNLPRWRTELLLTTTAQPNHFLPIAEISDTNHRDALSPGFENVYSKSR